MDTKKLRQKILDLAIRGKLVPQDPNDEPASVLLDRIRAEKEQLIKEGKIKRTKKSVASDTSHYENVPFEVPENWEWIKLGECGDVITGMTPSKDNKLYYGGKIPFYKPTDLEQGEYTLYSSDTLSTLGFSQCRQLPCNSILVTCIGATIGKTGIIKSRGACNQQINAIVPYCFLNYQYLYYVCVSNYMQTEIRDNSSSTTLPILNKSKFSELMIPLPPLNEQFRIIRAVKDTLLEIENLDRERHNLRNQIHNIKNLVIELAISGKLVPHKPLDEPATELLRRINPNYTSCDNRHYANVPYKVPQKWQWVTLSDISNYGECINVPVSNIPENSWILELEDIEKDSGRLIQRMNRSKKNINGVRHSFKKGDVLYSKLRTYLNKVLVADQDGYCTTEIIPITCVPGIVPEYLCHVLRSRYYVDYTISLGYGVKMPRLGTADALKSMIPVPPYEEQRRIVKSVNEIYHKLEQISSEL